MNNKQLTCLAFVVIIAVWFGIGLIGHVAHTECETDFYETVRYGSPVGPVLGCSAEVCEHQYAIITNCQCCSGTYEYVLSVSSADHYELITDGERRIFVVDPEGTVYIVIIKT